MNREALAALCAKAFLLTKILKRNIIQHGLFRV